MELFKDETIGDKRYRIGRMTAKVGSKITALLLPHLIPHLNGSLDVPTIIKMLPSLSGELDEIQDACLQVCCQYAENNPVPVVLRPGVWGIKELEYDSVTVMALTVHALVYNLAPFFTGGGLQTILQSVLGLSQSEQP